MLSDEQRAGVYRRLLCLALAESRARFQGLDAPLDDELAEPPPSPWEHVYEMHHIESGPHAPHTRTCLRRLTLPLLPLPALLLLLAPAPCCLPDLWPAQVCALASRAWPAAVAAATPTADDQPEA